VGQTNGRRRPTPGRGDPPPPGLPCRGARGAPRLKNEDRIALVLVFGHAGMPVHVVEQGQSFGHGRLLATELVGAGPAYAVDDAQGLRFLEKTVQMIGGFGQLGHELGGLAFQDDFDLAALLPHVDGV